MPLRIEVSRLKRHDDRMGRHEIRDTPQRLLVVEPVSTITTLDNPPQRTLAPFPFILQRLAALPVLALQVPMFRCRSRWGREAGWPPG
jgi:hypothetical protein